MAHYGDLTIDEAMRDPLILALMRADRQDPREVRHMLRDAAQRLDGDRRAADGHRASLAFPTGRFLQDCCGAGLAC